ncbi:hypothetical protein P3X46_001172 [Hevea brasiliensis]|uniref:tRNA-splicing endonuclease subunit Sen54 N-terminal domain-containing protein n=1 Tax=Hevea brasiliensis TaxID=3981 RepID=A0ABQ9NH07_HEVBR|nr:uncharacterized protein LOC110640783 [Hevea brasiliensis]XP_058004189.1 uncharacterized protein LOC110640783 [Hevea brasiliensis]KAJ9189924.1 hypothetical protein P3X46_001172 [Hevea brasiliensis]
MEVEDWETSSAELSDTEANLKDTNDEDLYYTPGSLPKLQFRSDISKARWDDEMGMAEVVEKKGKLWTTTGIVRNGKIYCSIEEILFLAELGALLLLDDKDIHFSLKDIYGKTVDEKNGCCWELFEVYRHLKSLGYIIQRHGVPWSMKGIKSNCNFDSFQGTSENNGVIIDTELKDSAVVVESLSNLQVDELRPNFDIYLPNSKFRKTSPGDPAFLLCLIRGSPPSKAKFEALERQCGQAPLKFCHVDQGRVSFFSFKRVDLPVLP